MRIDPSSLQARLDAMVREKIPAYLHGISDAPRSHLESVALDLLRQLDELGEALAERDARTCEWTYDDSEDSWNGTCGIKWALTEGTPEENEMRFCPGCGAALKGGQP